MIMALCLLDECGRRGPKAAYVSTRGCNAVVARQHVLPASIIASHRVISRSPSRPPRQWREFKLSEILVIA